jgi:hypothetical protein
MIIYKVGVQFLCEATPLLCLEAETIFVRLYKLWGNQELTLFFDVGPYHW